MTTASFSSVAQHVVGQYGQLGKIVVRTYRNGAKRLVTGANTRSVSFLKGRNLPLVDGTVKTRLIDMQTKIADALVDGIVAGTGRAERAIDFVTGSVHGGIDSAVTAVDRVEAALNTTALTGVGQLTLPVAKLSLAIANRSVEGTKRLSARVIGAGADGTAAMVTAKPTERNTKRTAKRATQRATQRVVQRGVTKAVRSVKGAAKAPVKAAARKARRV